MTGEVFLVRSKLSPTVFLRFNSSPVIDGLNNDVLVEGHHLLLKLEVICIS